MASDPLLQDKAFSFVRVAPRPVKPRPYGLTIIADRGWGMNRVGDVLEMAGEYIDWVKLGIGAYRLQSEEFLRRKIEAFKNHDVKIFFAGDVTEAAMQQGVSEAFYADVKRLGADAVEVPLGRALPSPPADSNVAQHHCHQGNHGHGLGGSP